MMTDYSIALLVFVCLSTASLGTMFISPKLAAHHRDDDTNAIIRLVANIFVVMTSLVFGLMINSSKNTFETVNASAHSYATSLILLDQSLRTYGLGGSEARSNLSRYVEIAIAQPARANDSLEGKADPAGIALDTLSDTLASLHPSDDYHQDLASDIRRQFQRVVEQRWMIIENRKA